MRLHGLANMNNRRNEKRKYKGRRKRAQKRKEEGVMTGDIVDAGITTVHHLKKRKSSPRANITLSGKKKRKLLNAIRREQSQKNRMETEAESSTKKSEPAVKSSKVKVTNSEQTETMDTA